MRPGNEHGTPLPPEIPQAGNPPSGAIIDYYLKTAPQGNVVLQILNDEGKVIRSYGSAEHPQAPKPSQVPFQSFWIPKPQVLSKEPGMHRFTWDLHYASVSPSRRLAFFRFLGGGPWAVAGQYQVRLIVDGQWFTRPLALRMDPRAHVALVDLQRQFNLAMGIEDRIAQAERTLNEARNVPKEPQDRRKRLAGMAGARTTMKAVEALDREVATLVRGPARGGEPQAMPEKSLAVVRGPLGLVEGIVESADQPPALTAEMLLHENGEALNRLVEQWNQLKATRLPALNRQLTSAGLPTITVSAPPPSN